MSTKQNDEWLEAAKDNFEEAVIDGNVSLAKEIIADVLDNGFREEAQAMTVALRELIISDDSENG